jgi:uncharacterized protein YegL
VKQNSSEIIFVVDRSGSMAKIADDMRGGFQAFIEEQKKLPGECKVTMARFNNTCETLYERKDLSEVPALDLQPQGGTALNDAVALTLQKVGQRLADTEEGERPEKILFVIITDGEENSSQEFQDTNKVLELITHQREKYSWEFIFLGASMNATQVAASMGIPQQNSVMFAANAGAQAQSVMRSASKAMMNYRSSGVIGASMGDHYSMSVDELQEEEKKVEEKKPRKRAP